VLTGTRGRIVGHSENGRDGGLACAIHYSKSLGLYRERSGRESLGEGEFPRPERSRYGDLQ
jgi:hypothetical protein